ncbi:MAG: DUF2911 domain-containing protein [Pseudohongiellaceae bacterium]
MYRPLRLACKPLTSLLASFFLASSSVILAQQSTPIASPAGSSATQILGQYSIREGYQNGKWVQIFYGRPIKRERNLFYVPDWREALLDGAEVWRAGANVSTRLVTEVELEFAGTSIAPGEYTVFIDFGSSPEPGDWQFVLSRWPAQQNYDYENKTALWGAYEYTDAKDAVRAPMQVSKSDMSFDQLSWQFADMNDGNGKLVLLWDDIRATVSFSY